MVPNQADSDHRGSGGGFVNGGTNNNDATDWINEFVGPNVETLCVALGYYFFL